MAGFWSDAEKIEPKRSFRWVFTMGKAAGADIQSFFVKTVKKPSFTVSEIEHQYVGHRFYFPGRVTWNPVEVTFVDPGDPDVAATLANIFVLGGYNTPITQEVAEKSLSKGLFAQNIGNPFIEALDSEGTTIEEWTLWNTWVTNIDFGQLDYSSDEMVIISMSLRYDYATLAKTSTKPLPGITATNPKP